MCLVTPYNEIKIAQEDIITYKVLKMDEINTPSSLYSTFRYELNKIYELKESLKLRGHMSVLNGTPRFFDDISVTQNIGYQRPVYKDSTRNILFSVSEGFHGFSSFIRAVDFLYDIKESFKGALYKCSIPKGGEYIEDITGLIVSNKIMVVDKIKEEDIHMSLIEKHGPSIITTGNKINHNVLKDVLDFELENLRVVYCNFIES